MKIFFLSFLIAITALARTTDDQAEIKIEKNLISITTKTGYHLNAEAPASATLDHLEALYKPVTKTEKLFTFKKEEKSKTANLSFYVCDDKKTVCEQHQETLNFKSGEIKKTEIKPTYNNIKDFNLKSENGKPTLLVFSAPWCPACIRMNTETYHKPEVKKQLAKLNFVKLNSDLPENNELSEKFKIKAIPTIILLDKNGNETFRWLDYQLAGAFAKSVEQELKKVDLSEVTLKNAQLGDAEAASALAFKAFNTLDFAEAVKWFALTKSEKDQKFKLSAEVSLAQEKAEADESLAKDYLQVLQKAIVLTPSKLDQIRWTIDFFDKKNELKTFNEEAKIKAKAIVGDIDEVLNNPLSTVSVFKESTYGEYGGFEKEELMWMKSRIYGLLDMKIAKENTDKASVELISKKKLSIERPGEMLMAISYLREAGEVAGVEGLYEQLTKKYPNSYVYFEKYARFAQKNKNLEKALGLANEALKFPEGNQPQLSLLKTQILKDLKKNDEALVVIEDTLKIDYIEHKRYAKTLKKLNELKNELKDEFNK